MKDVMCFARVTHLSGPEKFKVQDIYDLAEFEKILRYLKKEAIKFKWRLIPVDPK